MEFIVAGVVIFAIFVFGLVLAVEMVDAINKNRNGRNKTTIYRSRVFALYFSADSSRI